VASWLVSAQDHAGPSVTSARLCRAVRPRTLAAMCKHVGCRQQERSECQGVPSSTQSWSLMTAAAPGGQHVCLGWVKAMQCCCSSGLRALVTVGPFSQPLLRACIDADAGIINIDVFITYSTY
jgi:hypothetical protein